MPVLQGKVALVTGASKGLGAAIAQRLAADGASVVVNYSQSAAEAAAVVQKIEAGGGKAKAIQADVSQPAEGKLLVAETIAAFGQLDILVNNAGLYRLAPLEAIDEAHYALQFDLNVKGLIFVTQAAVSRLPQGGRIINISSFLGTDPIANGSVYCATKAAVDALTESLARELGPKGIRVNGVGPGLVPTEGHVNIPGAEGLCQHVAGITPLGRVGKPEDIAGAVAFLAGPDSDWVAGQTIVVSGGVKL